MGATRNQIDAARATHVADRSHAVCGPQTAVPGKPGGERPKQARGLVTVGDFVDSKRARAKTGTEFNTVLTEAAEAGAALDIVADRPHREYILDREQQHRQRTRTDGCAAIVLDAPPPPPLYRAAAAAAGSSSADDAEANSRAAAYAEITLVFVVIAAWIIGIILMLYGNFSLSGANSGGSKFAKAFQDLEPDVMDTLMRRNSWTNLLWWVPVFNIIPGGFQAAAINRVGE